MPQCSNRLCQILIEISLKYFVIVSYLVHSMVKSVLKYQNYQIYMYSYFLSVAYSTQGILQKTQMESK